MCLSLVQNSDMTGCDLQHANLRGSNLAGAVFTNIVAPLHMSQTVNVSDSSASVPSPDSTSGALTDRIRTSPPLSLSQIRALSPQINKYGFVLLCRDYRF